MESNSNNQEKTHDSSNFENTVAESKANLQNAEQKKVRKGRSDKGRVRKAFGDANNTAQVPSSLSSGTQTPNAPQDLSNFLAPPIKFLSKTPAIKYNIKELEFDDAEALAVAKSLNDCINAFIPDVNKMSPKTAAIVSVAMTVGSIGFNKYLIYQQVMSVRIKMAQDHAKRNAVTEVKPSEPSEDKVVDNGASELKLDPNRPQADNYFKR